jgi:predicted regulator of Ras-like GTPase activity (Roadblock/LC7/MglB family)
MLGSLKKLFFKDTGEDLATSIPEPVAIAPGNEWSTVSDDPAPAVAASEISPRSAFVANEPASPDRLTLPLQAILTRLPNSLASVVQSQGNGFISLPAQRIVQELPKGSVKIPFGELRHAAPAGTFFDNARLDQVLVELPLAEILARLHPSLLARRSDQKQIHLSPEITNVFGPHGEGISLSTAPVNTPRTVPKQTGDTSFVKQGDASLTARSDTSFRTRNMAPVSPGNIFSSPTAVVPPVQIVSAAPNLSEPLEPVVVPLNLICESWPEMVRVEMRELNLTNVPVAFPMDKLAEALKAGKIIFTWKQICAWMQPPITSPSGAQDAQVELPLKIMAPLFMAKHRAKAQRKITVAEIPDLFAQKPSEKPAETEPPEPVARPIAAAIRSATPATVPISPAVTPAAPQVAPAKPSIVPAAQVTPALPMQPKLQMKPDNITPFPKAIEPAKPVEIKPVAIEVKPVIPPAPVISPTPEPVVTNPSPIGEIFGQPARHNWSPAEVLKNLLTLPGMTGAFLAMQDGLLISAELPETIKAETVAAFLPQIFGRMNQYTKELQLGGLSSLTFVANHVSWQIVKSGVIYLVALSKPGENLPSAQLNTLATELSKQMQ